MNYFLYTSHKKKKTLDARDNPHMNPGHIGGR